MILSALQRRARPGLQFGNRIQRDIDEASILSEARYRVLPDRKTCIVCGSGLRRETGIMHVESAEEIRPRKNTFHPACSLTCRRKYLEWLYKE